MDSGDGLSCHLLKIENCHNPNFVATGGTISCRYDNLLYHPRQKFGFLIISPNPYNRRHSSPIRARYGVSVVSSKSDFSSVAVIALFCVISWYAHRVIMALDSTINLHSRKSIWNVVRKTLAILIRPECVNDQGTDRGNLHTPVGYVCPATGIDVVKGRATKLLDEWDQYMHQLKS